VKNNGVDAGREMIKRLEPMVKKFLQEKKTRGERYPEEVRTGVKSAIHMGVAPLEIRDTLGISVKLMNLWMGRNLTSRNNTTRKQTKSHVSSLAQVRELKIVSEPKECLGEIIRVHLPNRVMLEIPVRSVGSELLQGLMGLGSVCS
jgi:hypothetical protein